ncbi:GIY-YIG nuclease family protein [Cobetia sp. 1CM21F]|uniref:GIY-YIG nuclease family protein n=1 Tax=Cobetia sp. 1CM21F TaxID=2929163 RepID=UPI0020C01BE9|nr:GIY-YIG nuclease family protein [Cobetia sp. 1CM21F]MCK8067862.1 GIY-YIG nuclease family protein [Cobetia sp. 1CM21F]
MSQGRSIRLFLVDGTPSGLMTAEIMNWTGHVITGPRGKLSQLVQRPECSRTGIYFLIGPPAEDSSLPSVYIGESDDVATRLKQHNRPEDKGGKDFWERVCLVTSKDQNLTKAHVKHLESLLMQAAREAGQCRLLNGTAHEYGGLPESDRADMAFFMEQIRTVLPVLSFDFLRERPKPSASSTIVEPADISAQASPLFVAEVPRFGIKALGKEIEGEFYVLKGSLAKGSWTGKGGGYQNLYQQLCDNGVLIEAEKGLRCFSTDQAFSSPSAAAAVVSGRAANGREHWKTEATGQTYADWQDSVVMTTPSATDEGYTQ